MTDPASTVVLLGHPTHEATPGIELFPDPAEVIVDWSPTLADRVAPVLSLELARLDPAQSGRLVIVVWDDPAISFLTLQTGGEGRARLPEAAASFRPLDEPFERHALREEIGVGLALERLTLPLGPPRQMPDWDWQDRFGKALQAATGRFSVLDEIRFETYPCFMQDPGCSLDPFLYRCELNREAVGVGAGTFYVSSGPEGSFDIEMQMT